MRTWTKGATALAFGSLFALVQPMAAQAASQPDPHSKKSVHVADNVAATKSGKAVSHEIMAVHSASKLPQGKNGKVVYAVHTYASRGTSYGGISCVPFVRSVTGMDVKGNAANWWANAAGLYARGAQPEAGSVLNFRATGRMRLGHVAVVSRVINSREVEIDHANWWGPGAGKGGVSRAIPVIDVSENNDWSQVRVGLGHSGDFGSVYPTYGFIYDRPDRGSMVAAQSQRFQGTHQASYDHMVEAQVMQFPRVQAASFSESETVKQSLR